MKKAARLAAAANQPSDSIGTAEPYRAPRYRVTLVCETEGTGTAEPIRDSSTAVHLFRPCFDGLDREHFLVCGLDAKHRVIGINVVSVGTLTLSIVHPFLAQCPARSIEDVALAPLHTVHALALSLLTSPRVSIRRLPYPHLTLHIEPLLPLTRFLRSSPSVWCRSTMRSGRQNGVRC